MIVDNMDQSKFCWPRHPAFQGHDWDKFHRPRLHITGVIAHGHFVEIFIGDANMRKSGSATVDVLASVLTRLKRQGVSLADHNLYVQLDNTSSQNKNNVVLLWLAVLVSAKIVASATANFLRSGHSHEDIDQFFGEVAQYIANHGRFVHSLDHMADVLRRFFTQCRARIYEPLKLVTRMDWVRDWKSWLFAMKKKIVGIAGQAAPHVFEFILRSGSPTCALVFRVVPTFVLFQKNVP